MTVSRGEINVAIQADGQSIKHKPNNCISIAVRIVTTERTCRQMVGDLAITLVALPLLITCIVLLFSHMHSNWVRSYETRLRVLALGLCLLLLSMVVCVYTIRRLRLCVYPAHDIHDAAHPRCRRRTLSSRACPAPLLPSDSQLQLVVGGELPPSYDSLMRRPDFVQPPPYFTLTLTHETRSTLHPPYLHPTG